jgi:ribose transport system substrate-binding protein
MLIRLRSWSVGWCVALVASCFVGCDASVPKAGPSTGKNATGHDESQAAKVNTTTLAGGTKRIIILTNGDSPYWDACREGLNAANSELKLSDAGLKAVLDVNDGTPQGQLSKLQQYGTQSDIAAIGVSAIDANNVAVADELRSLQKKGVKVLTIDSDLDRAQFRDARFAFIGTDNLTGGKVLGTCAKGLKADGGEYVTFVGRTGAQNAIERIDGFGQGAGEKFVAKDKMADDTDKALARENVRNAIRNHAGLNVLVGIWSYNAPAIVDVVRELDRRKDFTVVVFDAEPGAITAMKDGQIDAMVVQNPFLMGYQGVKLMKAMIADDKAVISELLPNHGQPEGDIIDTGLKVIVPGDDSPLKADQFDKSVEFLALPAFQDWLTKYGLTGS